MKNLSPIIGNMEDAAADDADISMYSSENKHLKRRKLDNHDRCPVKPEDQDTSLLSCVGSDNR